MWVIFKAIAKLNRNRYENRQRIKDLYILISYNVMEGRECRTKKGGSICTPARLLATTHCVETKFRGATAHRAVALNLPLRAVRNTQVLLISTESSTPCSQHGTVATERDATWCAIRGEWNELRKEERETDRETERRRDRGTERQTERRRDRETERKIERERERRWKLREGMNGVPGRHEGLLRRRRRRREDAFSSNQNCIGTHTLFIFATRMHANT